jgi:hypothetical protein
MIFIFWRGYGFVMPIVAVASYALVEFSTELITHNSYYYQSHFWPMFGGTVLAGIATFFTAKLLARWNKPRVIIDKQTGDELEVMRRDTFFGIPAKYFPFVVLLIGTIVATASSR